MTRPVRVPRWVTSSRARDTVRTDPAEAAGSRGAAASATHTRGQPVIDTTPTAGELAAASEWRAANDAVAAIVERIKQDGYESVSIGDHAVTLGRIHNAAQAITIPPHLLTYNADNWPGRSPEHQLSIDVLRRREQHRQACDAWAVQRKLWYGDFVELQRRQLERQEA